MKFKKIMKKIKDNAKKIAIIFGLGVVCIAAVGIAHAIGYASGHDGATNDWFEMDNFFNN